MKKKYIPRGVEVSGRQQNCASESEEIRRQLRNLVDRVLYVGGVVSAGWSDGDADGKIRQRDTTAFVPTK